MDSTPVVAIPLAVVYALALLRYRSRTQPVAPHIHTTQCNCREVN